VSADLMTVPCSGIAGLAAETREPRMWQLAPAWRLLRQTSASAVCRASRSLCPRAGYA